MSEEEAICPSCETVGDKVGAACTQRVCQKKGYYFIPIESYRRYQKYISQPGAGEDPEIGHLIDRYLIVEKLGQGGMGSVYLAMQMPLMRKVALKMASGVVLDEVSRQRFEREAKAISILYHPNIVALIDFGFNPATGAPFMALEYVKGGRELANEIVQKRKRKETWQFSALMNIFTQVLNGLSIAHKSGLIHRDIKPQNIMLVNIEGNKNFVKLLDFGLARALVEIPGGSKLTLQGTIMGTPQYMAPEQIFGKGTVDHRCDIYAVGAILFEMITGKFLYPGETPREIFTQKMNPDFDPMKTLPSGILHPEVEFFLKKTLSKDPGGRFLSATEMKDALVETFSIVDEGMTGEGEDIGWATTMQMDVPPDLQKDSLSNMETRVEVDTSEESLPAVTKDVGSFDSPDEELGERKKISSTSILLLLGVAAAAALLFFYVLLPYFDSQPSGEGEEIQESGSEVKKGKKIVAAADTATSEEETGKIIEMSLPPWEKEEKTVTEGKKKGKKKEPKEPAEAAQDAGTAADAGAPEPPPAYVDTPLPQKPPADKLKKELQGLRKRLEKCDDGSPEALHVKVILTFEGKTGQVSGAEGLIIPPEKKECVNKAVAETKLDPFKEEAIGIPFLYPLAGKKTTEEPSSKDEGEDKGKAEDLKDANLDLSKKNIQYVIHKNKVKQKIYECANGKTGTAIAEIVVDGKTGKVKSATVVGGDFKGTPEGACMENVIEQLEFPPFVNKEAVFRRKFTIE